MMKFNKTLMYISFSIYLLLLVWMIVFKWTNYVAAQECIITFRHLDIGTRFNAISKGFFAFDLKDMMLNVLLFLPLGLLYTLLFKRKYMVLILSLILTFIFEISQFFTCIGMFSFSDILANILGCLLGYILFLLLIRLFNKKFIDTANIVIISLFSPLCIYAIIMTISNFHFYL